MERVFSNTGQGNVFFVDEPINKVYVTDNYSIFKYSKFNRNIIMRNEMIEQAKEGIVSPIIVNEHFIVIDGQHRLEASKIAKVPVEFIIKPGLTERDIVRMNTVQKPWSLKNHIEAHANEGKEDYVKLVNLINNKKYIGNVTALTQIATFQSSVQLSRKEIIDGDFKFKNFDKTVEFLEYLARFKEETKLPNKTKLSIALFELYQLRKFDPDRMITKTISTNLDEELKTKTLDLSDSKVHLIDAYNHGYNETSKNFIDYSVKPSGAVIINEKKADWARVDF